jgi:beta-glucosidase-like glycosyl hydrolase
MLEKAGLLSCAKHFPGHGDTSVDSHIALPVIRKSYEELLNTDIKPFSAAIRQGVSSIMIGHLSVPSVDTVPASLSQEIHAILRDALGFKGLILTDALTMHALKDIRDVPVRCLNAGVDILLHPADPEEAVNTLLSAVLSGQLSENRIDTSLYRIMKRKEALRNTVIKDVDYQSHAILSSQIAHKSVSLIRCAPGLAPLVQGENIHIFMTGDQEPALRSPLRSLSPNVWILHENPDYPDLHASKVIIAIYTSIAAWKENAAINQDEQQRIRNIISRSRKSVVISFGNPYVLRHFPEAGALIAAYEGTDQVQQTVVKWLRGLVRLEGKIPVSLS